MQLYQIILRKKKEKNYHLKEIGGDYVEILLMSIHFFQLEENILDLPKLEITLLIVNRIHWFKI